MFKPVAMTRLSAVVLERDERTVLRQLGQAGVIQLTRATAGPETAPLAPRDGSADTARVGQILNRVGSLRQSLGLPSPAAEPNGMVEFSLAEAEQNLCRMEEQTSALLKQRQRLLERTGELAVLNGQMSDYRGLEIPLDRPDESSFLHFVTGTLPAEKVGQFEVGDHVAVLPLGERNGRQLLVAMTSRQNRPALERALQATGFQPEILPVAAGATTETLSALNQRELEQIAAELQQVNAALEKFAEAFAPALDGIEQLAILEQRLCEAEQNFPRTETVILLTGWMPDDLASEWVPRLRELTRGRSIITTAFPGRTEREQIPVLLRHSRWLQPFEMLVSAYGLPSYRELEPTLLVAISYLLMFGMMFGDVGDGFILAAGGLAARCLGRKKTARDAGLLLLFGGFSSMAFGVTYGSYFGIPALKKFALWHDPLEGDPMRLITISIAIGVVMISLGLILNVFNRFRRGDAIGGCLDKYGLAGGWFYWGILALLVNHAGFQARGWVNAALVWFFAVPMLGWLLKEPVEWFRQRSAAHPAEPGRSLFAIVMESLVEVFEGVLGYFSNTISFVRLAAYSMSHAALLVATFMVAADLKHVSPGGGLLSLGVIITGNVLAFVLEGIVCSVQALRLEYYEFFGKFFAGNGQPFKPFRLQTTTVAEGPP